MRSKALGRIYTLRDNADPLRTLERYFVRILQTAVSAQTGPTRVKYITPGEHCPRVRVLDNQQVLSHADFGKTSEITFQVNTPTFYSRFCHYKSAHSAIVGELLDDERTRTTWCSDPEGFAAMFNVSNEGVTPPDWRWSFLERFRCPPELKNFEQKEPYQSFTGLSATDCWVLENCSSDEKREYRRSVIRVYLGERFGGVVLGPKGAHPELLGVSRDGVLRIYEAWAKGLVAALAVYSSQYSSPGTFAMGGFAMASINLWASLKTIV